MAGCRSCLRSAEGADATIRLGSAVPLPPAAPSARGCAGSPAVNSGASFVNVEPIGLLRCRSMRGGICGRSGALDCWPPIGDPRSVYDGVRGRGQFGDPGIDDVRERDPEAPTSAAEKEPGAPATPLTRGGVPPRRNDALAAKSCSAASLRISKARGERSRPAPPPPPPAAAAVAREREYPCCWADPDA